MKHAPHSLPADVSSGRSASRSTRHALTWLLIFWLPISSIGCSRAFWRKQADEDSYDAIVENLDNPLWAVPRIDITPDPRSRFFDPYDPDFEPLPPDDPAANVYMHWVDGWLGYQSWHKFGMLLSVENPHWLENFQMRPQFNPETGEYQQPLPEIQRMTLGQAIEISLINNRDYQFELERLFLAALAVTFERFQFGVRYLGFRGVPGADTLFNWQPDGGPRDTAALNSNFGVSQLLPTGGQWIVELTNNTLWLFAGENSTSTASVLSFSLVQPLLFGAGRKVVLEALTQRERLLLYAVRDLARFRQEFFVDIVTSYLNLLEQVQLIRNSESNIFRLREQVEALQVVASQRPGAIREPLVALPPGLEFPESVRDNIEFDAEKGELIWYGPMSPEQQEIMLTLSNDPVYQATVGELVQRLTLETVTLDVLNLKSSLANSINRLRSQEQGLQDRLDAFKIQLGLPTDFIITIDDSLLKPFQFIDVSLTGMEQDIRDFITVWGTLDDDEPDREDVAFVVQHFEELLTRSADTALGLLREDMAQVDANLAERLESLPTDEARAQVKYDVARDKRLFADAVATLEDVRTQMDTLVQKIQNPDLPFADVKLSVEEIKSHQEDLLKAIQSLQVVQVGIRTELISVQPFDIPMEDAVNLGLENRVDLMNQRAFVMDARRLEEVAANALRSTLDVEVSGDIRTPVGTDILDFRGDISDLRVGLGFDAPMDLIRERNAYRTTLIAYQRARRDYMLFEDQVKLQIRTSWRSLAVLKQNLETQRQAIRIAAAQFDNAVEQANAPPAPGQQRGGAAGLAGQNLQQALQNVLTAQNGLIGIWVDYEQSRLNIYRDMGIMEIGPDGVWSDPFYREQIYGTDPSFPGPPGYNGPQQPYDRNWCPDDRQADLSPQATVWELDGQARPADLPDWSAGGDWLGPPRMADQPDLQEAGS